MLRKLYFVKLEENVRLNDFSCEFANVFLTSLILVIVGFSLNKFYTKIVKLSYYVQKAYVFEILYSIWIYLSKKR